MKTNIILIDFENIQPKDLPALRGQPCKIKVFCGANQTKIPIELAAGLQPLGPEAEYVRIEGMGHDAADFHITYYIGRLSAELPAAAFYIVSNDTSYDPLIKHLKAHGISCQRVPSLSDVPGLLGDVKPKVDDAPASVKPALVASETTVNVAPRRAALPEERIQKVADRLLVQKVARPATLEKLRAFIKCQLNSHASEPAVDAVVIRLDHAGMRSHTDGKLSWP